MTKPLEVSCLASGRSEALAQVTVPAGSRDWKVGNGLLTSHISVCTFWISDKGMLLQHHNPNHNPWKMGVEIL